MRAKRVRKMDVDENLVSVLHILVLSDLVLTLTLTP